MVGCFNCLMYISDCILHNYQSSLDSGRNKTYPSQEKTHHSFVWVIPALPNIGYHLARSRRNRHQEATQPRESRGLPAKTD